MAFTKYIVKLQLLFSTSPKGNFYQPTAKANLSHSIEVEQKLLAPKAG